MSTIREVTEACVLSMRHWRVRDSVVDFDISRKYIEIAGVIVCGGGTLGCVL